MIHAQDDGACTGQHSPTTLSNKARVLCGPKDLCTRQGGPFLSCSLQRGKDAIWKCRPPTPSRFPHYSGAELSPDPIHSPCQVAAFSGLQLLCFLDFDL
jgi:hypothetical protein